MIKKYRFALCVSICALASFAQNASAQNVQENGYYTPFFIPAVYPHDDAWNKQDYTFEKPVAPHIISEDSEGAITTGNTTDAPVKYSNSFKTKDDGDKFVDKVMKKMPYGKSLKYTWNVIDGDVDLYFENLRVDRGNKGVSYKTNSLPMVGEMDGSEIKAELGEDSKLTFKSDYMPMVGRIDGLQFKASAGTGDSNISLRYKTDISW